MGAKGKTFIEVSSSVLFVCLFVCLIFNDII